MIRKKILVCGSAGFLMSNFMRYLLYMTKDFEIVSVDKLQNLKNYKNLYIHNHHRFYIGDITDEYFMDRLLYIENPDLIINGCFYSKEQANGFDKIISGTSNLLRARAPLIQICGCSDPSYDTYGFWNFISKCVVEDGETCIEIPNIFGYRQKLSPYFSVPWIHHELLEHKQVFVGDEIIPWVCAEDVASFIWYVMEKDIKGHLKIPESGNLSEKNIAEHIKNMYGLSNAEVVVKSSEFDHLITKYEAKNIEGWKPDSPNIYVSLEKTVKWFDVNRWAFNI